MKITAIYGTSHQGITVGMARDLISKLPDAQVREFFLPRDFDHFCTGCCACFAGEAPVCVQAQSALDPIWAAMADCDVLILASPVYVYHVTGAMKAFLDHLGSHWLVHRPDVSFGKKTAVLLTAAAGSGMKQTLGDLRDSCNWLGVGRVCSFGARVMALRPGELTDKTRAMLDGAMTRLAARVQKNAGRGPRIGVRARFFLSKTFMGGGIAPADHVYWREQGWMDGRVKPYAK